MRSRPLLFAIVAALALLVRLLVPAGFMPHVAHGQVAIVACPGVMPAPVHAHQHDESGHDGFERPCAFAAVAAAATVLALAVLLTRPFLRVVQRVSAMPAPAPPRATIRWRPPLRAPPAPILAR